MFWLHVGASKACAVAEWSAAQSVVVAIVAREAAVETLGTARIDDALSVASEALRAALAQRPRDKRWDAFRDAITDVVGLAAGALVARHRCRKVQTEAEGHKVCGVVARAVADRRLS